MSFALRGDSGTTSEPLLASKATTLQSMASSSATVDQSTEVVGATAKQAPPKANTRELHEQRDHSVHSSQQRITVAGTTTVNRPPAPELDLRSSNDNKVQLKAALGKQGTTAAQITLSQLEKQEERQLKEQLRKLGLSTKGSMEELKDRLPPARGPGSAGT